MSVYADTAMKLHPGLVFSDMETGGMFIDNDGMFGDIADARQDPARSFFDPNNADTGYIGVSLEDGTETDQDRDNRIFGDDDSDPSVLECQTLHGQDELQRLIIEQGLDDADITVPVKAKPKKKIPAGEYHDRRLGCYTKPKSHNDHGRNNRYKDHRQSRLAIPY